jgi:hypothetical protein
VNKGITSNWRWWQPSLDEMKVGRHSLTLHAMKEAADDADAKVKGELIAEFIFYAVDPPNRGALRVLTVMPPPSQTFCAGSTIKPPLMAMAKSFACSGKKGSDDPLLVIGSTSVKRDSEL